MIAGAAALFVAAHTRGADVSSTWNGGTGNWNDPAQWTPAAVPNNGSQTFDAIVNAGTATLSGNITLESFTLTGGTVIAPGSLPQPAKITANESVSLRSSGALRYVDIVAPTVTLDGGAPVISRGTLTSNGTLNVTAATSVTRGSFGNAFDGTLTSRGVTNINGSLELDRVRFNVSGAVNLNAPLRVRGGTWMAAIVNPGAGGSLTTSDGVTFDAASNIPGTTPLSVFGNTTFNFPMTRTVATTLTIGSARFNAPVVFNAPLTTGVSGHLEFAGGAEINVPVTLRGEIAGTVNLNASTNFNSGSSSFFDLPSVGGVVNNHSAVTIHDSSLRLEQSLFFGTDAVFNNHGRFAAVNGGGLRGSGGGTFNNIGKLSSAGNYFLDGVTFVNQGELSAPNGSVTLGSGTRFINAAGGVEVAGGFGAFHNNARLDIATSANPNAGVAGYMRIHGDYTMGPAGRLRIDLGGTTPQAQYDVLQTIAGDIQLDGWLDVSFINGFENLVTAADVFTIARSDSPINGHFAFHASGQRYNTIDSKGSFQVSYIGRDVVLSNFSTELNGVPEPGSALLLLSGTGAACLRRRRRTSLIT